MSLKDQITTEIKSAMKAKNTHRLEVLRFLFAQIKNKEITLRPKEITDHDILTVISKQVKQRQEGIKQFQEARREDLAQKEEKELIILKEFLPEPLSEDEIKQIINDVVSSFKEKEEDNKRIMGQVIKCVIEKTQGRADSKTISQLVRSKLSG